MNWEYCSAYMYPHDTASKLNSLGAEGWDLVAVVSNTFYFKRPVAAPAATPAPQSQPQQGKRR